MTLCEVGDKVVHLLWLHIFKYVNLLKNKSLFFYAQTFQRQQGIQVSTSYKKKKAPRTTGLGAAVCLGISS